MDIAQKHAACATAPYECQACSSRSGCTIRSPNSVAQRHTNSQNKSQTNLYKRSDANWHTQSRIPRRDANMTSVNLLQTIYSKRRLSARKQKTCQRHTGHKLAPQIAFRKNKYRHHSSLHRANASTAPVLLRPGHVLHKWVCLTDVWPFPGLDATQLHTIK